MVIRILSILLTGICCFGQSYTLQDQSFLGNLMSGNSGIQSCGSFSDGLIRYWKIDEGSGTFVTNYVSGNPIGASLVNGALWVNDGPTVLPSIRNNYCVQSPNYNSYVNCGNSDDYYIIPGNYSISVWTYHQNSYPRNIEMIIAGRQSAYGLFHFGMAVQGVGGVKKYVWGDITLGGLYVIGPEVSTVGANWTFWVMTRNGTKWTLWKDDPASGEAGSYTSSSQQSQTQPCTITIGGTGAGDFYNPQNWGGYVADVRVYKNYALSSNGVWCLYHQYYGR